LLQTDSIANLSHNLPIMVLEVQLGYTCVFVFFYLSSF